MSSAMKVALRLSVLAACSTPSWSFPSTPSFSASVVMNPLDYSQFNFTMWPYFHGVTVKFDAARGKTEWRLLYRTFDFVAPAFEYLASRQVCEGGKCRSVNRNGTSSCGDGGVANLMVLGELWPRMPEEAEHQGSREVNGVSCEAYRLEVPFEGNMTACIGKDGVPRSMLVMSSMYRVGISNSFVYSQNMTFEDIRLWETDGAEQIESVVCPAVAEGTCPGEGVQSFQVLRASMGEPWGELFDRDTFDWPGAGVTLGSPERPSFSSKKHLEVFDVEANSSYGRWRDCNYVAAEKKSICYPGVPDISAEQARLVARASAEQLEAAPGTGSQGQCGKNEQVGSWLVFPKDGRCDEGQAVGAAGCTWKLLRSKVVEMDCVKAFDSDGWARAWKEDYQKAPFLEVQRHMKAAVAACPDIRDSRLI